jgi:hypothetical protein
LSSFSIADASRVDRTPADLEADIAALPPARVAEHFLKRAARFRWNREEGLNGATCSLLPVRLIALPGILPA